MKRVLDAPQPASATTGSDLAGSLVLAMEAKMLTQMTRNWWMFGVRGACAILFGILAFVWPQQTALALVLVFGVFALLDGVLAMVAGLATYADHERWWAIAIGGLMEIIIGVFTLARPNITGMVLLSFIAAWAIFKGIFELGAGIELRQFIAHEWALVMGGLASIILGVLLVAFPSAGTVGLVWLLGFYGLVFGAALLVLAFQLRGFHQDIVVLNKGLKNDLNRSWI